ncbi:peptide MFS transporter [Acinetobacter sp. MD2(2019)]|uniref:peptide MFS transporter n=1 Tax=Acinetobacter sp. MD2(2019) TaxID=2605273 RepID=UPI002D1F5E97|nr:peptide MFS transporter [Acinetobacter sp. MD2(2019)]MEB3753282.1 peptide MFS transporter [Acinetobacter sp. MD2(2019)]
MENKDILRLDQDFFGHPKPLQGLFLTELWERFSYYGIRPLLILYMTAMISQGGLGLDRANAAAIVGLFAGCIYLFTLVGGWLSDHWLGQERAVWYGSIIIALGHLSIALTAWGSSVFFYLGLVFLVIGSGLFKTCISVIVGTLYQAQDQRRDAGFSIFYMGINLGAFFAPLITGALLKNYGWHIGFGIGGVGMLVSLLIFRGLAMPQVARLRADFPLPQPAANSKQIRSIKRGVMLATLALITAIWSVYQGWVIIQPIAIIEYFALFIVAVVMSYFAYLFLFKGLNRTEKYRLILCFILFVAATLFWAVFEQQPTSLNLFAQDYTNRSIGSFEIPTVWFQSINAIFIIIFSPIAAWVWMTLARRQREPSYLAKFSLALVFAALGFAIMILAAQQVLNHGGLVSPFWLISCLLMMTFGELCLSPVGLSAMTKLAPKGLGGQMMGIWFTASAVGNLVAGWIGGHVSGNQLNQLPPLFSKCVMILLIGAVILALLRKPMLRLMQQQTEQG